MVTGSNLARSWRSATPTRDLPSLSTPAHCGIATLTDGRLMSVARGATQMKSAAYPDEVVSIGDQNACSIRTVDGYAVPVNVGSWATFSRGQNQSAGEFHFVCPHAVDSSYNTSTYLISGQITITNEDPGLNLMMIDFIGSHFYQATRAHITRLVTTGSMVLPVDIYASFSTGLIDVYVSGLPNSTTFEAWFAMSYRRA